MPKGNTAKRPLVLGIDGSPYFPSHTSDVLGPALLGARNAGARIMQVSARDYVRFHDGRRNEKLALKKRLAKVPKKMRELLALILKADGVIFATPTHSFSTSGQMKVLIDWMITELDYPEFKLEGRVMGLMATCDEDGAQSALEKMASPLNHIGYILPPYCMYFTNNNARESEGNWQQKDMELVGHNVAAMAGLLKGRKNLWAE